MMRKIKIVGVLTILVIVVDLAFSLGDFAQGFQEGARDSLRGNKDKWGMPCLLEVEQVSTSADSLFNTKLEKNVPYRSLKIQAFAEMPVWVYFISPLILIAGIAYLIGFVCLIRLLIAISRKNVFVQKNIHYLRFFAYSQAALYILYWVDTWAMGHYAAQQLKSPAFDVLGGIDPGIDWKLVMIVILFAEIFAVGVKIKEEQDLTV